VDRNISPSKVLFLVLFLQLSGQAEIKEMSCMFCHLRNAESELGSWNRGIDSEKTWNAVRSKIAGSNCDIVFVQETRREAFDMSYMRKFWLLQFDSFVHFHSMQILVLQV
jgi:hypothetical protein